MPPPSRAGIINGTLTWQRTNNPRRHPCTWCKAPAGAPCRHANGRDLTWYHADRITTAAAEPDPGDRDEPAPEHDVPPGHPTHHPDSPDPRPDPPPTHHTATPVLVRRPAPRTPLPPQPSRTRHEACATWLHHQLDQLGGTAPAHDILNAALAAGYSRTTLHRARTRLGITCHKPGYTTGWTWNLPTPTLEPTIPETAMTSLTEAGQLALTINTRARHGHRNH